MAIDTQAKRMSALLEGFEWPAGVIGAPERAAIAWQYTGNEFPIPTVITMPNVDIIVGLNQFGQQGPSIGGM
jgi:hypothetical protein